MIIRIILILFLLFNFTCANTAVGQEPNSSNIDLGEEYSDYNKGRLPSARGKASGGRCLKCKEQAKQISSVLMYVPNRILDFFDIFRVDVGLGGSYGGVLRLSEPLQMGIRKFPIGSMRIGLHGRQWPVFFEDKGEYGFGPDFHNTPQRKVTPVEIGVGVDLIVPAAYVGISFDELADFVLGIFTYDMSGDDY
ncbi:MAG: hypothetical protein IT292_02335 [Deltaproteobacteria bacterium]|nr:hypothetical protein [Deltaproteobacteria bacterium]